MKISPKIAGALAAVAMVTTLAACSGGGSSPAASGSGDSTTPITVNLGLVQGQDFVHALPARVAASQGFFTKEGLKVSIVAFTSGSDLTKAMAGGSIDVAAATGLDAVSASAHGVDLQAFFGVEGPSPMTLIVPANSSIKTFADLSGKKVGISAFGSMTDYVLRAALAKSNVNVADVKEVPLGAPSSTIAAMGTGDIDALVLPVSFGYTLEASGKGKIAQSASDLIGKTDQFGVLMASKDYLSSNKDAATRMAAAYKDAITWMAANKDGTTALAVSALGMTKDVAGTTYDSLIGNFTADGKLNAAGLAAYAKALPELKIASSTPAESTYLNTSITG